MWFLVFFPSSACWRQDAPQTNQYGTLSHTKRTDHQEHFFFLNCSKELQSRRWRSCKDGLCTANTQSLPTLADLWRAKEVSGHWRWLMHSQSEYQQHQQICDSSLSCPFSRCSLLGNHQSIECKCGQCAQFSIYPFVCASSLPRKLLPLITHTHLQFVVGSVWVAALNKIEFEYSYSFPSPPS